MPHLGAWQAQGLALFSLGVVWAESSALTKVAEKLVPFGKADSLERRLQRWVSNPRLDMTLCFTAWIRWVVGAFDHPQLTLLVDETRLGNHVRVMMVGLAYQQRCIPLIWRCYTTYPAEGQVQLIDGLLRRLAQAVRWEVPPLLQADRGLGTSPALIRAVERLGWTYLFRVQNHTKIITRQQRVYALNRVVHRPGQSWSGSGVVFKQRGRLLADVHVLWAHGQPEPWCLVTNHHLVSAACYARRVWQEESFRDLKSGGFQWQHSRVWQPPHAEHLLLVLALAYAWTLTHGTLVMAGDPVWRRRVTRGTRPRFSWFRLGLRYLSQALWLQQPVYLGLFFAPHQRLC
jgi:hypothetical protein